MAIESSIVPTGIIFPFAGSTAPTDWLLCDGKSYLKADYQNLFTIIGTTYGSQNSLSFNVPDYRFSFLRGNAANITFTGSGTASATVTFTDIGDLVTLTNHGLTNGSKIRFKTITTTTGITTTNDYYVINATTNNFQLSSTYNGSVLPLTNNGTGVFKDFAIFTNHGITRTGMLVRFSSGTLTGISNLSNPTTVDHYAIVINENNLAFASSYADAITGLSAARTISGANSAQFNQWEDPDIATRLQAAFGGSTSGVGTRQEDQFQSHTHTVQSGFNDAPASIVSDGSSFNYNTTTGATGGNETRPRNVYVNYIIKI